MVRVTYAFWEYFVIGLCTSMVLFETGDSIPLIYGIRCMCGRLLYLLVNLKGTFVCVSHTCYAALLSVTVKWSYNFKLHLNFV